MFLLSLIIFSFYIFADTFIFDSKYSQYGTISRMDAVMNRVILQTLYVISDNAYCLLKP